MMRTALRARRFFPLAPRKQAARQAVAYARAVAYLGPNWLFVKQVQRVQ